MTISLSDAMGAVTRAQEKYSKVDAGSYRWFEGRKVRKDALEGLCTAFEQFESMLVNDPPESISEEAKALLKNVREKFHIVEKDESCGKIKRALHSFLGLFTNTKYVYVKGGSDAIDKIVNRVLAPGASLVEGSGASSGHSIQAAVPRQGLEIVTGVFTGVMSQAGDTPQIQEIKRQLLELSTKGQPEPAVAQKWMPNGKIYEVVIEGERFNLNFGGAKNFLIYFDQKTGNFSVNLKGSMENFSSVIKLETCLKEQGFYSVKEIAQEKKEVQQKLKDFDLYSFDSEEIARRHLGDILDGAPADRSVCAVVKQAGDIIKILSKKGSDAVKETPIDHELYEILKDKKSVENVMKGLGIEGIVVYKEDQLPKLAQDKIDEFYRVRDEECLTAAKLEDIKKIIGSQNVQNAVALDWDNLEKTSGMITVSGSPNDVVVKFNLTTSPGLFTVQHDDRPHSYATMEKLLEVEGNVLPQNILLGKKLNDRKEKYVAFVQQTGTSSRWAFGFGGKKPLTTITVNGENKSVEYVFDANAEGEGQWMLSASGKEAASKEDLIRQLQPPTN